LDGVIRFETAQAAAQVVTRRERRRVVEHGAEAAVDPERIDDGALDEIRCGRDPVARRVIVEAPVGA
jgi:hypothetical protein